MKKQYDTPVLSVQELQLGVFGDYDGGDDNPTPIHVIEGFEIRMD